MTSKILCATDGSGHSRSAILHAAELSAKTGASLTICTVNVAMGGMRAPVVYMREEKEVRDILDSAAKLARDNGAKSVSEVELKSREAAGAVVQYAEENGFDHIVTGTGDKHGMSRLILGSVAADIAGRAHCTVTVAR
jgi:nucleotide-binding universal stress UspA family protein